MLKSSFSRSLLKIIQEGAAILRFPSPLASYDQEAPTQVTAPRDTSFLPPLPSHPFPPPRHPAFPPPPGGGPRWQQVYRGPGALPSLHASWAELKAGLGGAPAWRINPAHQSLTATGWRIWPPRFSYDWSLASSLGFFWSHTRPQN